MDNTKKPKTLASNALSIVWLRRDLRLHDSAAIWNAQQQANTIIFVFIFDRKILDGLQDRDDARVTFIYQEIYNLKRQLQALGSDLVVRYGIPEQVWPEILDEYQPDMVFANKDYEPYAKLRDAKIAKLCKANRTTFTLYKDQVIFDEMEVVSNSGTVYKVFGQYKKKWLSQLSPEFLPDYGPLTEESLYTAEKPLPCPTLADMGFTESTQEIPSRKINTELIAEYDKMRDFPSERGTSRLGIHLRFGTISIRQLIKEVQSINTVFLSELIWREFFMNILNHFPYVVERSFKPKFDTIEWINNEGDFERWCTGNTGVPIVDAGMRQLNATGFMHNRVRMICASFLTKNLLIDWRWGEAYFARMLLDYELANNNGGWQWAAGTGVDAQPYFRIFNPDSQTDRWDPKRTYIQHWVPEWNTPAYPAKPMVNLKESRQRALNVFKAAAQY